MEKLPFGLRQKGRDVADDIMKVRQREITIEDIAGFVEKWARASSHPIFGKISKETRSDKSALRSARPTGGLSFATSGIANVPSPRAKLKCLHCTGKHWLSQCENFKRKPVEERFKLIHSLKLCDNCLTSGHVARACQKRSFCKIEGCKFKHSTFLHRKVSNITREKEKSTQNKGDSPAVEQQPKVKEKTGQSGYVNVGEKRRATRSITGMPILPVKVKVKDSN